MPDQGYILKVVAGLAELERVVSFNENIINKNNKLILLHRAEYRRKKNFDTARNITLAAVDIVRSMSKLSMAVRVSTSEELHEPAR